MLALLTSEASAQVGRYLGDDLALDRCHRSGLIPRLRSSEHLPHLGYGSDEPVPLIAALRASNEVSHRFWDLLLHRGGHVLVDVGHPGQFVAEPGGAGRIGDAVFGQPGPLGVPSLVEGEAPQDRRPAPVRVG